MKKQWISIKCGLSRDPKHRRAMANSIWLFMHMLDLADWNTGVIEDWRDEAEAEEMGMELRTLREQRRELNELSYITCTQKQRGQRIVIHNWTNPREYTGEIYNQKQGDNKMSPKKEQIQGYVQGYAQGSIKNVTPTSGPKTKDQSLKAAAKPKTKTPDEVKLFRETTDRFPPKVNYVDVVTSISKIKDRLGRDVTRDDLLPFYKKWCGLGYKPVNLAWLEWAEIGQFPVNATGKTIKQNNQEPKGFDAGRKFLERHGVKQDG